jgi:hypothetical protein
MFNIKKVGIFYTDNTNPHITKIVLETLIKNTKDIKIITCSNEEINDNPFENLIYYNPERSHKNITEKIQYCINHLKNIGEYEYISFLEHDVLYPENYFDFPEFNGCICNMNYIGICEKGFQEKLPAQLPLHQMTMRFEYAINHFEEKMRIIEKQGWDCLEPNEVERYNTKYPSIHINHGRHFTSHYQCYTNANSINNEYWGDSKLIWDKIL